MRLRTLLLLLVMLALVASACARPRGGGRSGDDDDAANDDDSASNDDDAADDDDAGDDDDDDDDDDGAGPLDGSWEGTCEGLVILVGFGELPCAGTFSLQISGGISDGTLTCVPKGFPVDCGGTWTDGAVPGTLDLTMPGCLVTTAELSLTANGTSLIEGTLFAEDGTLGTVDVLCDAARD